jgi:hypothetical protein
MTCALLKLKLILSYSTLIMLVNIARRTLILLQGVLKRFGQRKPLVVTGANIVIAGNGTLEAAKKLGWSEIVVAYVPSDWTFEHARAYALVDNRTAELAEWDADKLAMQLIELDSVGWELDDVGFEKLEPPTNELKDKKSNWVDCDDCGRKVLEKNVESTETD